MQKIISWRPLCCCLTSYLFGQYLKKRAAMDEPWQAMEEEDMQAVEKQILNPNQVKDVRSK